MITDHTNALWYLQEVSNNLARLTTEAIVRLAGYQCKLVMCLMVIKIAMLL